MILTSFDKHIRLQKEHPSWGSGHMALPSASIAPEQVTVFTKGSYSDSQVPSSGLGEKTPHFPFTWKNQNTNATLTTLGTFTVQRTQMLWDVLLSICFFVRAFKKCRILAYVDIYSYFLILKRHIMLLWKNICLYHDVESQKQIQMYVHSKYCMSGCYVN